MEKGSFRQYMYFLLEPWSSDKGFSFFLDGIITAIIIINIIGLSLETVTGMPDFVYTVLRYIELFSIAFFTVEYLLRVWISIENDDYKKYVFPRLAYMVSFFAIIDLLAILPFYIMFFFQVNFKFLLILRLFRLLKLVRYFRALQLMTRVFQSKSQELFIAIFFTITLLIFISFLMYYVEGPHQPEHFGSVPETMWWGIITLTTVGYGDVVPITGWGKFFGGCIAVLGIGIFALPAGILASGFSNELEKMTATENEEKDIDFSCEKCGHLNIRNHDH
ncbi:MAG: ion transporter [Cryomorphaceae bacterium]|nr:ion transporter [Cryomorphaceae bacterium]